MVVLTRVAWSLVLVAAGSSEAFVAPARRASGGALVVRAAPVAAEVALADCRCNSGQPYAECCALLHESAAARDEAPPLAILQARYTAYLEDKPDFIIATTHPSNEEWTEDTDAWRNRIRDFAMSAKFVDLVVFSREAVEEDKVKITWKARIKLLDGIVDAEYVETTDFFECSIFLREGGKWWYSKGDPDFEPKNIRVSGPLDKPPVGPRRTAQGRTSSRESREREPARPASRPRARAA